MKPCASGSSSLYSAEKGSQASNSSHDLKLEALLDVLFDHPFGSDWSRRVSDVVVGDSASMAHPCRSVCVRMMFGSGGGILGNRCGSSAVNIKTWMVFGDL